MEIEKEKTTKENNSTFIFYFLVVIEINKCDYILLAIVYEIIKIKSNVGIYF